MSIPLNIQFELDWAIEFLADQVDSDKALHQLVFFEKSIDEGSPYIAERLSLLTLAIDPETRAEWDYEDRQRLAILSSDLYQLQAMR